MALRNWDKFSPFFGGRVVVSSVVDYVDFSLRLGQQGLVSGDRGRAYKITPFGSLSSSKGRAKVSFCLSISTSLVALVVSI
ncbi:hypothetical protein LCGC14_2229550 [marine sediment metagenome]|uniref:Uncharacterized protein n=1 Tax=marine sediment metagenome TaxID=412755 RepID=A0A0F9DWB5_9ZZZZ